MALLFFPPCFPSCLAPGLLLSPPPLNCHHISIVCRFGACSGRQATTLAQYSCVRHRRRRRSGVKIGRVGWSVFPPASSRSSPLFTQPIDHAPRIFRAQPWFPPPPPPSPSNPILARGGFCAFRSPSSLVLVPRPRNMILIVFVVSRSGTSFGLFRRAFVFGRVGCQPPHLFALLPPPSSLHHPATPKKERETILPPWALCLPCTGRGCTRPRGAYPEACWTMLCVLLVLGWWVGGRRFAPPRVCVGRNGRSVRGQARPDGRRSFNWYAPGFGRGVVGGWSSWQRRSQADDDDA